MADEAFDLDMAAATIRANSSDLRIMLKALVTQLGDTLGERLQLSRAGGLLRKSQDLKGVQVTLGDDVFTAEIQGSSVQCAISHSSGGIRIRNERVDMDSWLKRLLKALEAEATYSDSAREALQRIVLGGTS